MHPLLALPLTALLLTRAYHRHSLTPLGLLTAGLTALIHALPATPLPFTLLGTFFLIGTSATKVKHAEKAKLTLSSSGSSGGEGPRTHVQVLANSGVVTLLCLLEFFTRQRDAESAACFALRTGTPAMVAGTSPFHDWLVLGCIANYASVAADTLSSELGILSRAKPVLITAPWRKVAKGTNGGISPAGVLYGHLGALAMGVTSVMVVPFCGGEDAWGWNERMVFVALIGVWGTIGSLLDSLLGALLQASVVDRRTGKIVEGAGGIKVKVVRSGSFGAAGGKGSAVEVGGDGLRAREGNAKTATKVQIAGQESRIISAGRDILDNNGINFLMAATMTVGGIVLGQLVRAVI